MPTMVDAYSHGIFPWPVDDGTVYWWSPDPRAVIPLDGLHISRSLRRTLRAERFRCTRDAAFREVVEACAQPRDGGTWIIPPLAAAYLRLHHAGIAHSVEVWQGDALVGGLLGITAGAAFTGESMFHRVTDASKVALVHLVEHLRARDFMLLDVQLPTAHLKSLGALSVPRSLFLDELAEAVARDARW